LNSARPWRPTGDDHLIFEWVKMQGKTQREVAGMFGIDQSTVSRVIQRYERWQAHAKEREGGRIPMPGPIPTIKLKPKAPRASFVFQ